MPALNIYISKEDEAAMAVLAPEQKKAVTDKLRSALRRQLKAAQDAVPAAKSPRNG